jgi:hypothetical protein
MSKEVAQILLSDHSKAHINRVVKWIGIDKKRFAGLIKLVLGKDPVLAFRASWAMDYCTEKHPAIVKPHLEKLIDNLLLPNQHPSVYRCTIRILQHIEIPEKLLGKVVDTCFRLLQDSNSAVAVKAFSMTVLSNALKYEPDLANELEIVIREQMIEGSAAIQSRGKKILKQIGQLKSTKC